MADEILEDLSEVKGKIPYTIEVPGGAIVKKGSIDIKKKQLIHLRLRPQPRSFFVSKVIKTPGSTSTTKSKFGPFTWKSTKKVKDKFRVAWNLFYAPALGPDQEKPLYSPELNNLLVADDMIQMRDGVKEANKFILDEQVLRLLLIMFGMSIPFGILLNTILNFIPTQVVHWIP